jgi:hypothetical protein
MNISVQFFGFISDYPMTYYLFKTIPKDGFSLMMSMNMNVL